MFTHQATAPAPVLSTRAGWRVAEGGYRPVLCITNGTSRIFVDSSDFASIAQRMADILDAEQEVAS